MGMISQLLADAYTGNDFMRELKDVLILIFGAAGALCTLYAIYIGYLFATASDDAKRRTAKNRFIKILSTALIIVALAFVMGGMELNFNTNYNKGGSESGGSTGGLTEMEQNTTGIIYNSTPTLKFEYMSLYDTSYATITLYPKYITKVDDRTTYKTAVFENFQFEGLPTKFSTLCTQKISPNNNGSLLINFSVTSLNIEELEGLTYPYYEKVGDESTKYWKAKASYKLNGVPNSIDIYINLDYMDALKYMDKPTSSFQLLKESK